MVWNVNKSFQICKRWCWESRRSFASESVKKLPELCSSCEPVLYPHPFYSVNNWLVTFFTIRPQLDSQFNLLEFVKTSKKVIEIVSSKLAAGETDVLSGMLTPHALHQVVTNLSKFSPSQRRELLVIADDICFSYPYRITVTDIAGHNRKSVEVLTVHQVLRGYKDMQQSLNVFDMQQRKEAPPNVATDGYVLNYKFVREYGDEDSSWTISMLNHYTANQLFS